MSKLTSEGIAEVLSLPEFSNITLSSQLSVTAANNIFPRSPSHESFATDLSLMSLSSLGSDIGRMRCSSFRPKTDSGTEGGDSGDERRSPIMMEDNIGGWLARARSARQGNSGLLQVPAEQYGGTKRIVPDDILYEEENEAIRNCGALSSMLGLMRSFSTSDLDQGPLFPPDNPRLTVSDVVLNSWKNYEMPCRRMEYTSRTCSTWVAVGDISTTSQLPSPQTLAGYAAEHPEMSGVDFVRAINKKVRQMYIRRRLESTYRALERLTRSELSLDLPPVAVPMPATNKSSPISSSNPTGLDTTTAAAHQTNPASTSTASPLPQFHISTELDRSIRHELQISSVGFRGANKTLSLTVKDIERDKGKPLSKYERNMMIFNWLQSLDETGFDQLS